jgi:hypothetical protein
MQNKIVSPEETTWFDGTKPKKHLASLLRDFPTLETARPPHAHFDRSGLAALSASHQSRRAHGMSSLSSHVLIFQLQYFSFNLKIRPPRSIHNADATALAAQLVPWETTTVPAASNATSTPRQCRTSESPGYLPRFRALFLPVLAGLLV